MRAACIPPIESRKPLCEPYPESSHQDEFGNYDEGTTIRGLVFKKMFEDMDAHMETMASIPKTTTCVQPTIIVVGSIATRGLHLH
jgi:hypothetical protein